MKTLSAFLGFIVLTIVFATSLATASETLTRDEVEKLLTGNTAEGMNTQFEFRMTWYFQNNGIIKKQKGTGQRGKGEWSIDKEGKLCYMDKHREEPACEPVIRESDGKYYANDGKWRFDKVLPGNPHGL